MSEARFAGVDWASEEHAVCVVDEQGRIVEGRRFRHDEPGIRALCARLVRLEVALVALERPDGLLIERLLDAGLLVVAVHPNQVKAMRPRYSVGRITGICSDPTIRIPHPGEGVAARAARSVWGPPHRHRF